jgi:hypothetical protein
MENKPKKKRDASPGDQAAFPLLPDRRGTTRIFTTRPLEIDTHCASFILKSSRMPYGKELQIGSATENGFLPLFRFGTKDGPAIMRFYLGPHAQPQEGKGNYAPPEEVTRCTRVMLLNFIQASEEERQRLAAGISDAYTHF